MAAKRRFVRTWLVLAGVLLLAVAVLAGSWVFISARAARQFGLPSPGLTWVQRLIFPLELFFNREKLIMPHDPTGAEQVFVIAEGESVSMICYRLEQSGLVDDADLLRIYLIYTGADRHLKSGHFRLAAGMTPIQIAEAFLEVTPTEAVVSVLPGWRIEEVARNIAGSGLGITAMEFTAAAYSPSRPYLVALPIDEAASLEGFLYPGSYVFDRQAGLDEVIGVLLGAFSDAVDEPLQAGFARQGLSVYEAVTLASIIEKEAVVEDEKPLIASVLYNRLAVGMRLQTDPTVQYSLGYQEDSQTWWKSPLSLADLTVESPYNTYLISGLPPTPISNPGLASLRSAAFPAETPYLFFRAACDGSGRHLFAITFEEHLENACVE